MNEQQKARIVFLASKIEKTYRDAERDERLSPTVWGFAVGIAERASAEAFRIAQEFDDPTPYCTHCGPRSACDCGPIAENE